ncbi:hypothetical protein H6G27_35495 [Nostoc linckia FACHB-104]|nr:hypothetical protein [Nostoc linckia FACHB-104]
MLVTQLEIDELLEILKTHLEQIFFLKEQAQTLEKALAEAENDYYQKLGDINAEADRLESLKASLLSRLAPKQERMPAIRDTFIGNFEEPPQLVESFVTPMSLSPLPQADPKAQRKRTLADHIELFLRDSERETTMQVINAVLADNHRDMGDMLELLVWGDIWKARADWESLEEQYTRLQEWHKALLERLNYWHNVLQYREQDPRYELQEIRSRGQESWFTFLDDLAQKQVAENAKLDHEVKVLEQQLQVKKTKNNEVNNE